MKKIEEKEFQRLVEEGIELIPERIMKMLENVDICIEEKPSGELKIGKGRYLFGLYQGIPKTKRWNYGFSLPDKITIFKEPIISYAKSNEEVREIVKETVWHEIAHHFGLDEREVANLSKKRKQ